MEVVFQNTRQDFDAFYTYMVNDTEQGKKVKKVVFSNWLKWTIVTSMFFGAFAWGWSGRWLVGIGITILLFLFYSGLKLLITGFQPIFMPAFEVYKKQDESLTAKDLQIAQLPRTITIDDKWLEVRSSEALHRWRWRRVDQISLTPNFIFIHVGSCPVVYIPKRDLPSEQSFIEFGNRLKELKEKSKDELIGAE